MRSVFAEKKKMGQRGQRERVSLYFSTSCLFSCVRICCQRWYQVHVGGVLINLGASRIVGLEIWVDWFVGFWLELL